MHIISATETTFGRSMGNSKGTRLRPEERKKNKPFRERGLGQACLERMIQRLSETRN
jgi:hypothetical protein